jgi:hypothetical protein
MRRLLALGAAATVVVYVLRRRRRIAVEPAAGNGSSPAGSAELRRFVEASERQRTSNSLDS